MMTLEAPHLTMGIVLRDLRAYQQLVHVFSAEPAVSTLDFTFKAPLYKATAGIKAALPDCKSALDKFDVYFEHGILDEDVRVALAERFRTQYVQHHPRTEASDLFFASGEVIHVGFTLKNPHDLDKPSQAVAAIAAHPHDDGVLSRLVEKKAVHPEHLKGEIRLYLDHVYNPRRRKEEAVQRVMTGSRTNDPVTVEMFSDGAIPGYFVYTLEPAIDEVDGALVWLEG